jgi:serine/threonine-protein kinase
MSTNEKLAPGMVLGRYELLLPIAQGGMATVWAARQRGTRGFNKTVAIKTMLPTLSDDAQFEQMFLDEAALAARIHHPNVAEILDLGEQDDILYIVMEWVEGEALSVLHKAVKRNEAQFPMRLALRVARQAAAALHAAHELKDESDTPLRLVHRDVSPQNILCTYDGIVKLVDFGVAKAVGRAGGETTAGQLKGKVPYMSPEQARGGTIDRRTDIFALGIVMYKLTTGLHPFMGENDIATMRNIISRPLIPPRVKNPGFPTEVEQVLLRCMQKDPEKRFQTMVDLGQAIDRVLVGMGAADDDLGAFVRSTMGDRGNKRRAAIRDAVRTADERYATGQHAIVQLSPPQTVHEGVSDAVLTRMTTEIGEAILSEPATGGGTPSSPGPASSASWPGPVSRPSLDGFPGGIPSSRVSSTESESQGRTDQAVIVAVRGPRRRSGLLLGVAATLAGIALVAGGVRFSVNKRAARDARNRAVAAAAMGGPERSLEAPPPVPPEPVVLPAPTVSAVATASVVATASAAATVAEAAPASTGTVVAVAGGKLKAWPKKRGAAASAGEAKPAQGAPDGKAAPEGKIVSDGKTVYTNPGF